MSWKCAICDTINDDTLNSCEVCNAAPPLFVDFSCTCTDVAKPSLCKCLVNNADKVYLQINDCEPEEVFADEIPLAIDKPTKLTLIAINKVTERKRTIVVDVEKPNIQTFEVEGSSISINGDAYVMWEVQNAASCTINGVNKKNVGKEVVKISDGITIVATNNVGSVTRRLSPVVPPSPIISFYASKNKLHAGQHETTLLSWEVQYMEQCKLLSTDEVLQENCENKGSIALSPTDTITYTLQVLALDKKTTIDKSLSINVYPEATFSFSADKEYVFPSIPFTLSWNTQNAKSVSLNGNKVPLNGQSVIDKGINKETTYTLRITDDFGTKEQSVTIRLLPMPRIEIQVPTVSIQTAVPTINMPIPQIHLEAPYVQIKQPSLDITQVRKHKPITNLLACKIGKLLEQSYITIQKYIQNEQYK